MDEHPDKARLLKFPKEVLVDYFLRQQLFEIEWKSLELASLLFRYRQLISKVEKLTEQQRVTAVSISRWVKLEEEYQRTQKRMDSLRKRISKLNGIGR